MKRKSNDEDFILAKQSKLYFFRKRASILLLSIFSFVCVNTVTVFASYDTETILQQQRKTITGKVVDADGMPIIGANIIEDGTSHGTVTDIDGNFTLEVANNARILVTYIGYSAQTINTAGQTTFDILMQEDTIGLEEFVAVGYGVQRKSVVTGAISSVSMDEIRPVATQRIDQMLQGQAAGVMVLNTDGAPGSETTIRIRGMNSIQGGNNALIVIDGFQGGELRSINPNDIASIEVLKDASATAIYGAQGANGVILITTKKGTSAKPIINYSSEVGRSKIHMGGIELMNAADYARELNFLESLNDLDRTPVLPFTEADIQNLEKTGGTNWIDEVFRTSIVHTHQLSLSGRTSGINYYMSGSFLDQEGILLNSGYERYSLRSNLGAEVNDWLRVSLNWDGAIQNRFGADFGGGIDWPGNPIAGAMIFSPTIPVYDEEGNYSRANNKVGDPTVWNPVASARETINKRRNIHNIINLVLDFTFSDYLTLQVNGGARIAQSEINQFLNTKTFTGIQNNGSGRVQNSYSTDLQNSNILTYVRDFGLHNINFTNVAEFKFNKGYWSNIANTEFTLQETQFYDLGGAKIQRTTSGYGDRKIVSGVSRLNYAYDNKYLLSASIRADGSSVFGKNNKWGYFPAASVGWRLSQENFMQDTDNWLDNLMLRASWGKTGNQAIGNYQTISSVASAGLYPWDGGDGVNLGYEVASAANPNLKWESTRQYNLGLDFTVLGGAIRFSGDYYDKLTTNLLMRRELPKSTGLNNIIDNVGSMSNTGWEFSANGHFRFNELEWNPGINTTFSRTTVKDLGNDKFISYAAGGSGHSTNIPFMFLTVGEPFGQIMGFGYEGTWKTGEENEAAKYGQMPGDPRYTDVNGDGKIDYDHDFKVIGNALPKMIFGINNQFKYKDFDLTFLFQGTYGNDVFNVGRIKRETGVGSSTAKFDRWTPDNQNTDIPAGFKATYRDAYRVAWDAAHPDQPLRSTITFPTTGENVNERWIEDGSYIRLKNITLGYTIDNVSVFNSVRVYVTGTNLLTFTKYSGFDPEVSSYTGSDAQLGTDYNSYPPSKIFTFGINLTL